MDWDWDGWEGFTKENFSCFKFQYTIHIKYYNYQIKNEMLEKFFIEYFWNYKELISLSSIRRNVLFKYTVNMNNALHQNWQLELTDGWSNLNFIPFPSCFYRFYSSHKICHIPIQYWLMLLEPREANLFLIAPSRKLLIFVM